MILKETKQIHGFVPPRSGEFLALAEIRRPGAPSRRPQLTGIPFSALPRPRHHRPGVGGGPTFVDSSILPRQFPYMKSALSLVRGLCAFTFASYSLSLPVSAADSWPDFRGPTGDGHVGLRVNLIPVTRFNSVS